MIEGETLIIITDHAALTWSKTYQGVNRRLLTWGVIFNSYPKMHIVHRAGRVHSNVDPLSRMATNIPLFKAPVKDPEIPLELGSEELHGEEWRNQFYDRKPAEAFAVDTVEASSELISRYVEGYKKDTYFTRIFEQLKKIKDWRRPDITLFFIKDNGLLFKYGPDGEEKLCVPKSEVLDVLKEHDGKEGHHFGWDKTYNTISRDRYWPKMARDIREYVPFWANT